MLTTKTILTLAAAAELALTLVAAPAFANAPAQVRVSTADLDLSSQSGRRVLRQRLDGAAGRLCADERQLDTAAACRRAVLDDVAQPTIAFNGNAR
ncbi:UrcA family protein [Sphingomonas sp.]|uniref:UrcA family protein n=1 Tax=Sphingomonas sp. TaxID=28214 RepID=UPI003B009847